MAKKYPSEKKRAKSREQYSDDRLAAIVYNRKWTAMNAIDGDLANRRENLLSRYLGERYGDEREGQSKVTTRECLEAVEWTLPSLMRVFASSDQVVEFIPDGPEDEEAAKQESRYVNHVFMKENNGFVCLFTWIKDILMNPNAYVKVYADEETFSEVEKYEGLMAPDLATLLADPDVEPISQNEYEVEGPTIPGFPTQTVTCFDIEIRRTVKEGKVRVVPIPPEELIIDGKTVEVSLENADFVVHSVIKTRSDLIAEGFDEDVVLKIPSKVEERDETELRRWSTAGNEGDDDYHTANDVMTELVEVDEAYMRIDYDGDGYAELRRITTAGGQSSGQSSGQGRGSVLLENEEVSYMPFVAGTAVPVPHAHVGLAWQELVEDLQKIYTVLTRQMLNNAYRVNNPRPVVGRGVNLTDVLNDMPNSPIRAKNIQDIRMEPVLPIIQPLTGTFNVLDQRKEARTGVSRTTMGLDADALSRVTKGAFLGSMEQANQRLELLARVIAEFSIKPLFLKIHRLLMTHQQATKNAKIAGSWAQINPSEWKERKNMTVLVGLGTGNKQNQAMVLQEVASLQERILAKGQAGQMLVSPNNVFNTAARLVEVAGLHSPENYFTDPSRPPQQQTPGAAWPQPEGGGEDPMAEATKMMAEVEMQKAQLKSQADQMQIQQKAQADQMKMQGEILRLQNDTRLKQEELQLRERDLERKEQEMLLKAELKATEILQKEDEADLSRQQAEAEEALAETETVEE